MLTLDDMSGDKLDFEPVNVIEFLTDGCGFDPSVATQIAFHAAIKFEMLPLELIREAAIDLGYEVPTFVCQPISLKDRN